MVDLRRAGRGLVVRADGRARRPKAALEAVSRAYRSSRYDPRRAPWPRVFGRGAHLQRGGNAGRPPGLSGRLKYPDYEVIVIDDGSRDATAGNRRRYPALHQRAERWAGAGLEPGDRRGEGEIIVFPDCDASAEPDWLYFLVTALEQQDAVAVGGPNLSPPGDGFVAQRSTARRATRRMC